MDGQGLKQRARKPVGSGINPSPTSQVDATQLPPPAEKDKLKQYIRAATLLLFFFSTAICEFVTQLLGAWLYFYNREWYYTWMAVTKQHFTLLLLTVTQWWSPTLIRVTGDSTVQAQLRQESDGTISCDFPERIILVANHQIYTEWIYLWWIAYCSRMHGYIYIIMKESLKYIPLLGQGMMFFSFVFLSRHWETDRPRFAHRLRKLKTRYTHANASAPNGTASSVSSYLMPMWLLIFPEGTNLSQNQRNKSEAWAAKTSQTPMRHCLIPRSTGLKFCIDELGDTVDWIYDSTIAYEGIAANQYAQDIYTIRTVFLQGHTPKAVDMYFRRFAVKDIPHQDAKEFENWLHDRWVEKDDLLEFYHQNGRFPASDAELDSAKSATATSPEGVIGAAKVDRKPLVVQGKVRPKTRTELLQVFLPVLTLWMLVLQARKLVTRFLV